MKNRKLGKGLSALIGGNLSELEPDSGSMTSVPVTQLYAGQFQPREVFDTEALLELSSSIRSKGVIQPIIVRAKPNGYEIIAGERRWRASKMAGLIEVPVIICEMDDKQCLEFSIIENVQRKDLTQLEEAKAYKKLIDLYSYTHEELAAVVGKSRSHISNLLRSLLLPESVHEMLSDGRLSHGHARAIICADNPQQIAEDIVRNNLSVRQTEKLVKTRAAINIEKKSGNNEDVAFVRKLISDVLGLGVELHEDKGVGKLVIHFNNLDQLRTFLSRIGVESA